MFLQKAEAEVEAESEKNQGRYNLRRRKDDGGAKPAAVVAEQQEKDGVKEAAPPAATLSTPLDFGGKIGRVQNAQEVQFCNLRLYKCIVLKTTN